MKIRINKLLAAILTLLLLGCSNDDDPFSASGGIADVFVTPGIFITDPNGYSLGEWGNPPLHPDFGEVENQVAMDSILIQPSDKFRMFQLYPNPSPSSVSIYFVSGLPAFSAKAWVVPVLGQSVENPLLLSTGYGEIFQVSSPIIGTIYEEENLDPGAYVFSWDGKDDLGNTVPDGFYRIFLQVDEYLLWRDFSNSFELIGWNRHE